MRRRSRYTKWNHFNRKYSVEAGKWMRQQWQEKIRCAISFFFASAEWNCNGFSRLFSPIYFSLFDIVGKSFPPLTLVHQAPSALYPLGHPASVHCNLQSLTPKWIGRCAVGVAEPWPRMKKLGQCVCVCGRARAQTCEKKLKTFLYCYYKSEMRTRFRAHRK